MSEFWCHFTSCLFIIFFQERVWLAVCFHVFCLFLILIISRFGFEGDVWFLNATVPIHYFLLLKHRNLRVSKVRFFEYGNSSLVFNTGKV